MAPLKRQLSRALVFSATVLLTIGVTTLIYFLQIGKNEERQDQLQFRELNQIPSAITTTLSKLQNVAENSLSSVTEQNYQQKVQQITRSRDLASFRYESFVMEASQYPIVINDNGITNVYADDRRRYDGHYPKFAVNTLDFIPVDVERYSMVLIVDEKGVLLARRDYVQNDPSSYEIVFQDLTWLTKALTENSVTGASSAILERELAGINYRLYVQPFSLGQLEVNKNNAFVVGIIPSSTMNLAKLKIAPSTTMWIVLILLLMISFIPLIKLRFINRKYAFNSADVSQVGIGLVVFSGVMGIALQQYIFYQYFYQSKIEQAQTIHQHISQDFTNEIQALYQHTNSQEFVEARAFLEEQGGCELLESAAYRNCVDEKMSFYKTHSQPSKHQQLANAGTAYIIESLANLDDKGDIVTSMPIHYVDSALFFTQALNLSHREYYKRGIECDVWDVPGMASYNSDCSKGIYIQRINNIEDGRKSTQLSVPLFNNSNAANKELLIFNTSLRTFLSRIMPINFGFAVYDQNGAVLFHSDDELSLIENIFVETNLQNELLIHSQNMHIHTTPIEMEVVYKGKDNVFIAGPLAATQDQSQPIPWNLVVFYDKEEAQINNMLLIFLAVILFLATIVPIFLLMRYMVARGYWRDIIYFMPNKAPRYKRWAVMLAAIAFANLFMMGLLDDLIDRLFLWAVSGVWVLYFLRKRHRSHLRDHSWRRYPETYGIFILAILFIFMLGTKRITLEVITMNWIGGGVSLALLLGGCWYLIQGRRDKIPKSLYTYGHENVDQRRYAQSYVAYLTMLAIFSGGLPAMMMANSANGYLLQRQAELQSYYIHSASQMRYKKQQDYLEYLNLTNNDIAQKYNQAWGNSADWFSIFPQTISVEHDSAAEPSQWIRFNGKTTTHTHNESQSKQNKLHVNYADDVIDSLLAGMQLDKSFSARLTYLSKIELQAAKDTSDLNQHYLELKHNITYRPDQFIYSSWMNPLSWNVLSTLLAILLLFKSIDALVIRRLLGEHLSGHFRVIKPADAQSSKRIPWPFIKALKNKAPELGKKGVRIQLLNATPERTEQVFQYNQIELFEARVLHISECIEQKNGLFVVEQALIAEASSKDTMITIAINGLDELTQNIEARQGSLTMLSHLERLPWLNIVLVSDIAPMYRILKQASYPNNNEVEPLSADEQLSWSRLFSGYEKEYDWVPQTKSRLKDATQLNKVVEHEAKGWFELAGIVDKLYEYHRRIKCSEGNQEPLEQHWVYDQIIEFFLVHASPYYRKHWELCTREEKIALYQMANGDMVNPANFAVIERLVRRGFIYRDKGWNILNESLRSFILHAETDETVSGWIDETVSGLWQLMRIPIFTVLFVLVIIVVYASGQAIDSILGIATATLGLIPLLLRNISMLKGNVSPPD